MGQGELKKASVFYLVGNIFNKGMAFLTVPIFTRLLTVSDYGIVTTYTSWVSIISLVVGMALYMGIRAAFTENESNIPEIMSVTTTFTLIWGVLLTFVVCLGLSWLNKNIRISLILLCFIQGIFTALIENCSMVLMMQFRYRCRTLLMVLPNFLSAVFSVFVIVFIVKKEAYYGRILPTVVITMIFGLAIAVSIYSKSKLLFNKKLLQKLLKISAPLVGHGMALYILSQSDRSMITWLANSSQTGIYSLVYNFSMIATVITTSLDGLWIPWFIQKLKSREVQNINLRARNYINMITYLLIPLILVGPEIVKILADHRYWEGVIIIPPIVLSNYIIFGYTLYVNIEHYYKKTVHITVNTVIAAAINLALNFIFIPRYGYVAAAYTTLISYLVSFLLHAKYAGSLEKDLYPFGFFGRSITHLILATLLFYVSLNFFVFRWIATVMYMFYMVFCERDNIKNIIKKSM